MSPQLSQQFYETPYWYARNYFQNYTSAVGPSLPNGPFNDQLQSDGDSDFFARRSVGVQANFNDAAGNAFITSVGQLVGGFVQDFPLAPEKLYPLGTAIPIQMIVAANALPAAFTLRFPGVTTAFVGVAPVDFQGVKRWKGRPANNPGYTFYEKDYTYVSSFVQDWTYLIGPPYTTFNVAANRRFQFPINDYDFELWSIKVNSDFNNNSASSYKGFMIKLYDPNGYALMKDFIHYRQLSYVGGFAGGGIHPGGNLQFVANGWPSPPVVYPKGSVLQYEILSLLDTSGGAPNPGALQTIQFGGVRRIPC